MKKLSYEEGKTRMKKLLLKLHKHKKYEVCLQCVSMGYRSCMEDFEAFIKKRKKRKGD